MSRHASRKNAAVPGPTRRSRRSLMRRCCGSRWTGFTVGARKLVGQLTDRTYSIPDRAPGQLVTRTWGPQITPVARAGRRQPNGHRCPRIWPGSVTQALSPNLGVGGSCARSRECRRRYLETRSSGVELGALRRRFKIVPVRLSETWPGPAFLWNDEEANASLSRTRHRSRSCPSDTKTFDLSWIEESQAGQTHDVVAHGTCRLLPAGTCARRRCAADGGRGRRGSISATRRPVPFVPGRP